MHSQCIAWTRRNFAFGRCCSRRFSTIVAWLKWKQSQMLAFSWNFWPERVCVQALVLRLPANLGESEENCRWSGCSPPRNAWTRLKDTESVQSGSIFFWAYRIYILSGFMFGTLLKTCEKTLLLVLLEKVSWTSMTWSWTAREGKRRLVSTIVQDKENVCDMKTVWRS